MATVTKENIGHLHEKLTVTIDKNDYFPSFEKALKEYGKQANIPGFRKGMVPASLIKKMYGASLFTDEVLKTADRQLIDYLEKDKLDIFAQPIPMMSSIESIDMNNPKEYSFDFEIGMKPEFTLPALESAKITRYVVTVTDEMIENEIDRLRNRHGNMKDIEVVDSEDNVLNLSFTETDAEGNDVEGGASKDNSVLVKYFAHAQRQQWIGKKAGDSVVLQLKEAFEEKEREWIISDLGAKEDAEAPNKYFRITITKIGQLEKRELNEEFYEQLHPGQDVKTETEFRSKIKDEIQGYWNAQSQSQISDQVYHQLIDHTQITFPEAFLKNWLRNTDANGKARQPKSDEEIEKEFPNFLNQLKWTLISDKIVQDNAIQVSPDEVRAFAKQQLFSYMGGANLSDDQPWVNDYVEKMMKDRKYVEDAYNRIQTQKIFEWAAGQVKPTDKSISAEEFTKMVEEHHHHH